MCGAIKSRDAEAIGQILSLNKVLLAMDEVVRQLETLESGSEILARVAPAVPMTDSGDEGPAFFMWEDQLYKVARSKRNGTPYKKFATKQDVTRTLEHIAAKPGPYANEQLADIVQVPASRMQVIVGALVCAGVLEKRKRGQYALSAAHEGEAVEHWLQLLDELPKRPDLLKGV